MTFQLVDQFSSVGWEIPDEVAQVQHIQTIAAKTHNQFSCASVQNSNKIQDPQKKDSQSISQYHIDTKKLNKLIQNSLQKELNDSKTSNSQKQNDNETHQQIPNEIIPECRNQWANTYQQKKSLSFAKDSPAGQRIFINI